MQRTVRFGQLLAVAFLASSLLALPTHAQFRDVTPGRASEDAEVPDLEPQPMETADVEESEGEHVEEEALAESDAESLHEQLDDSLLVDDTEIRPLRFRGVLVGETTEAELLEMWGEPDKTVAGGDVRIIKFRIEPFRQVDVSVSQGVVVSVLIHIDGVLDPEHIAQELRMTKIESVPVPDQFGSVLGLAYPERGVLFGFDGRDPESLVNKIHLEAINPEPFVLRAEYDFDRNFDQNFADIETAIEMNPRYARAMWIKSRKLVEIGRFHDAIEAINSAINYDSDEPTYRLAKARLMMVNGNRDAARREIINCANATGYRMKSWPPPS